MTTNRSTRWVATLVAGATVGVLAVAGVALLSDGGGDRTSASTPPLGSITPVRTISVSGEGKVRVRPDTANVQMGVQVNGETAQAVLDEANEHAEALIAALRALGVADDDIATAGISIYPQYSSNGNTVTGYQAANNLNVTIRDIARAGEIIDAGAAFAGEAITIGGIWFSVSDPESVLSAARADAIENAKKRAGEYAAAAGATVGDVMQISEVGITPPQPLYYERSMGYAGADAASVPVQAGTQDLSVSVTVVFELR